MVTPPDETTADPYAAIAAMRQQLAERSAERDAALAEKADLATALAGRTAELVERNSEYGERIAQQAATIDVLKVMSASPADPQPVFNLIVDRARKLCESYSVALYQYDGTLVRISAFGGPTPTQDELDYVAMFPMPPTRSSIACRAILDGEIIHIRDMRADPGLSPAVRALDMGSILAIPLIRDGKVIGTFNLNSREVGGFTDSQTELLKTFAEQAVIAITSAEMYRALEGRTSDLQEALEQQTATAEVLQVINASPGDLTPVFDTILEKAHRLCGATHGNLTLFDGEHLRAVATRGVSEAYARILRTPRVSEPGTPTPPARCIGYLVTKSSRSTCGVSLLHFFQSFGKNLPNSYESIATSRRRNSIFQPP